MSWSVSAKGKASDVGDSIKQQFESMNPNPEPEETIKQEVKNMLLSAINSEPKDAKLDVAAWGSQSTVNSERHYNSLAINIKVEW
jgi:hypothetical protein